MMKKAFAAMMLLVLVVPMVFVSNVSAPTVGFSDNGILAEQWHYDMQSLYTTLMFGSSSCIADLGVNNVGGEPNSDLEIIVGSDEYLNFYPELGAWTNGIWRVLDSQGNLELAIDTGTDESRSSPTVADMTGDGYLDIIGGTTSGWNVEVFDRFGNWIWTFPWPPTQGGPYMWHSSPAVADVNASEGGLEVFIGNNPYGNVWALDGDNTDGVDTGITVTDYWASGAEGTDWDVIWKFNTGGIVYSSPALGDVDNDGEIEVVIGSGDGNIYILNGPTGTLEWSYMTGGAVYASAAIANLDGDPFLEIVMGSGDGNIYCLEWKHSTGSVQWTYSTGSPVNSSAAIGDIDGDGAPEIVDASTNGNVYALDASGSVEWICATGSSTVSSPALADRASVNPHDMDWPMFRHDRERTGFYGASPGPQGLDVYIGADDQYLYLIEGGGGGGAGGAVIDRFLTYGRLYTSPSVADIDGDSRLEIVLYDAEPGRYDAVDMRHEYTYWCIEDKVRTLDKRIHKKVKVIPAPMQFWSQFVGGVTDIIVFDPPEITEPVALVREYAVLYDGEGPIPLELLTWEETEYLPWIPIDTPETPYILPPDGVVEYNIYTDPGATAVLVRYTVAWACNPDIIETHFINEAILESESPQVIVGQLSNFDVHNDYHEPVDNFELELYGIQTSDIVGWFPGWGTPPQTHPMPPKGGMPAGTEIIWADPTQPVMPCEWVHFGLHLKPGVIAAGVKAYWTQLPSAELGDVIHNKIDVTVLPGETVTVVDTLPSMVGYISGSFTVDGVPATPTITKIQPPTPPIHEISYSITTPGIHLIEFDVKVDMAKNWEDTEVCNVATATWYNEAGEVIEIKEDVECFTIHPFEELHKNVGIPKADVVFAIDLSGSMSSELSVIQTQAPTIINNIASQIADVQFGLITFMDYVGTYTTTSTVPGAVPATYTDTYGSTTPPWNDYPYNLDQDIGGAAAVITAISVLTSGNGVDWPQDYSRILHESWNDNNLHWRTGATRFLILFGDAWPHDTGFDFDNNGVPNNAGGDPGRDAWMGTSDDLDFETEVGNVAAAGIRVMAVYSGGAGTEHAWTYMADQTGGQFFSLTEAEQIPDAIQEIIKAEAQETLIIKEKTNVQWAVVIDVVNTFPYTMTNVNITDRFGAEIEIDPPFPYCITHGSASYYLSHGVSDKVFVIWNIGDLLEGETARLIFLVSTDTNPGKGDCNKDGEVSILDALITMSSFGTSVNPHADSNKDGEVNVLDALILLNNFDCPFEGKQEYTESGEYELNSGATLKFIDPEQDMQLSAYTDSIHVVVLPEEDP